MNKKNKPLISVIIPVKVSSYHLLFEGIPAFERQTYKNFELIILPNEHVQYDQVLLRKYKWLRIIPTGKITRPAEKRNEGVKEAKGEIIAFIDDDAYPAEDWLEQAAGLFKKKVAAVCGPGLLPESADKWEKIFDQVVSSKLGSGGYTYRFSPEKQRFVDDYPSMNFFVRKDIFQKIGGFKGDYWPGEDSKLCEEIVYNQGARILYSPQVVVYHHRRKDLKGFLEQHANYGFHRGAFFAHGDKNSRRVAYLIPTFFVGYLFLAIVAVILLSIFKPSDGNLEILLAFFFLPGIIYLIFTAQLFFKSLLENKGLSVASLSPLTLFLTHITYGIIFVKGFFKGLKHKENIYG